MRSPSSIFSAICKYDSLLDALHGGDSHLHQEETALVIINIYFGDCSIFEQTFDDILSSVSEDSLSMSVIEEALHRSVRHLCDCECFLSAYRPIREFTFFWRDITIDDFTDCGGSTTGSPNRRRRIKKENVLSGWSCKLPMLESSVSESQEVGAISRAERRIPAPVTFISPDGTEFNTKAKAINYLNKSFPSLQQSASEITHCTTTTPLIDITTEINTLYSPLGLLEELFLYDPWKLLVSTICLNVTTRAQVDRVLYEYLQRWPDAEATAKANWEEISSVVETLGLGTKRAKALIRFSKEYLALVEGTDAFSLTENQVKSLYNIGQYGWTAYQGKEPERSAIRY